YPVLGCSTDAYSCSFLLPLSLPPCRGRGTAAFEEFLHGLAGSLSTWEFLVSAKAVVYSEKQPACPPSLAADSLTTLSFLLLKPGRPLAARSPSGMFKSNSDAVSREARITCGWPMP